MRRAGNHLTCRPGACIPTIAPRAAASSEVIPPFANLAGLLHRSPILCRPYPSDTDTTRLCAAHPRLRHHVSRQHHALRDGLQPRHPCTRSRLRVRTVCLPRLRSRPFVFALVLSALARPHPHSTLIDISRRLEPETKRLLPRPPPRLRRRRRLRPPSSVLRPRPRPRPRPRTPPQNSSATPPLFLVKPADASASSLHGRDLFEPTSH